MDWDWLKMVWNWLTSENARNFGVFLGGITAFSVFVVGCFNFYKWKKERRLEKRSTIAKETLNFLEPAVSKMEDWLKFAVTWFVYNRHSPTNEQIYQSATEEGKIQFNKIADEGEYELTNYCKSCIDLEKKLIVAKNRATRLVNNDINEKFERLLKLVKRFTNELSHMYHPGLKTSETIESRKFLSKEAPIQFNDTCESIKSLLYKELLLKSSM